MTKKMQATRTPILLAFATLAATNSTAQPPKLEPETKAWLDSMSKPTPPPEEFSECDPRTCSVKPQDAAKPKDPKLTVPPTKPVPRRAAMTPDQVRAQAEAAVKQRADADVPAQYRGRWCEATERSTSKTSSITYYRCRKATSEAYLHIRRDRINLSEEGDCRITAVTSSAKGHRLRVYCPPDVLSDPPEHVNLRLDARGRLHFDSTKAEATGWEYDWRRCMVGRSVGNYGFRFLADYSPPYVIDFAISDGDPNFKVGSVWLGSASWVLDDGKLGSRAEVLPHLRQGNTLVVYSTNGDSVLRWQIEGGDKVAKFLIDCPRYWESGAWERRHRKHR